MTNRVVFRATPERMLRAAQISGERLDCGPDCVADAPNHTGDMFGYETWDGVQRAVGKIRGDEHIGGCDCLFAASMEALQRGIHQQLATTPDGHLRSSLVRLARILEDAARRGDCIRIFTFETW